MIELYVKTKYCNTDSNYTKLLIMFKIPDKEWNKYSPIHRLFIHAGEPYIVISSLYRNIETAMGEQKQELEIRVDKLENETWKDNAYGIDKYGFLYPEGAMLDKKFLPDGIWYCRHHEFSTGTTSVNYIAEATGAEKILDNEGKQIEGVFRLGDKSLIDMETLCGIYDLAEKVLQGKNYERINGQKTMIEFVSTILCIAQNEIQKEKENNKKD